ncbi:hypothetical protein DERP_008893 [Dermatophagoides pteronyssinus]|uniref:Uncharacterized protein n=1 Tax=Dermatophagoides pteronyssinus TaxID=6956 RepID=A0ABQ8JNV7_DERPT|nr:hypothetical protein DERP_008893 [Dermatophagoides pteronyssinus]
MNSAFENSNEKKKLGKKTKNTIFPLMGEYFCLFDVNGMKMKIENDFFHITPQYSLRRQLSDDYYYHYRSKILSILLLILLIQVVLFQSINHKTNTADRFKVAIIS